MKEFYSPAPIDDYFVPTLDRCEARGITRLDEITAKAVWNLFWLSNPCIDSMPLLGQHWWKEYRPTRGLAAAVTADVMDDEALFRKLLLPPHRFVDFFEREDPTTYHTYEILGDAWQPMVVDRAKQAAARATQGTPNLKSVGNVTFLAWVKEKV